MIRPKYLLRRLPAGLLALMATVEAQAHPGHGGHGSFIESMFHSLGGLDHLLIAVSIGAVAFLITRLYR